MIFSTNFIWPNSFILIALISIFIINLIGIYLYKKIALRAGIIANKNTRTLHTDPVPLGGGIVFSSVFVLSILLFWFLGEVSIDIVKIFFFGAAAAAIFGFIDDLKNIKASIKLIFQIFLSGWTIYCLEGGLIFVSPSIPIVVSFLLTLFLLVWVINAYNFMDGIDGMAISGATFVSLILAMVVLITNGELEFFLIFLLLLSCTGAFLVFNWPAASIFMGDAGSIFLGYFFGSMILITITSGDISMWAWIIAFGYFFGDTTMTQVMRVILVKKWYLAHRSHAYQNLARITNSHFRITAGVTAYHLIWIFPLMIWSALHPEMEIFAAILAIVPSLLFTYKYGPALSSS